MDLPRCKAWRAEWDKADIEIVMGPESAATCVEAWPPTIKVIKILKGWNRDGLFGGMS